MSVLNFFPWAHGFENAALLITRILAAIVFASHGWYKSFGKQKFRGSAERFAERGIPLPLFFSYVTSLSQLLAVPLLLFGFLTQWIAILMALEMVVAIWAKYMDTKAVFDGMDLPLSDLAICLVLIAFGPGAYALLR